MKFIEESPWLDALSEAVQITKHKWGNPLAATRCVDQDQ